MTQIYRTRIQVTELSMLAEGVYLLSNGIKHKLEFIECVVKLSFFFENSDFNVVLEVDLNHNRFIGAEENPPAFRPVLSDTGCIVDFRLSD